jgi:MFS family permease
VTADAGARAGFGEVFAVTEFRALWLAQVLSVSGDQLARVALTVLVYDRTRSALLAAITFAASVVPAFIGSLVLSGLADRLPRRQVMIGTALVSGVLVAVMVVPGVPLAVLVVLLCAVTMVEALSAAAKSAVYPEILLGDLYPVGTAVTLATTQFAQVAGFAAGGAVVAFLGARASLIADAATFGAAALIIRTWVRARPVPVAPPSAADRLDAAAQPVSRRQARPHLASSVVAGLRLVFGSPAMRTPMLFGWLCAFYNVPEGVAAPLATAAGGGAVAIGLILAAPALGSAVGFLGFSRLVSPAKRNRLTGPLAIATCACLVPFAARPGLGAGLPILVLSGVFTCYQIAATATFARATPAAQRSQAFGIAQGGISLGQGIFILLAGAAAQHAAAALVIASAGGLGALCALALTLTTSLHGQVPSPERRGGRIEA